MRIVIEGITGKDLYLLMLVLGKLDFENKVSLLENWELLLKEVEHKVERKKSEVNTGG